MHRWSAFLLMTVPTYDYCLNFDLGENQRLGCFHHQKRYTDWPIVESYSSANVCGLVGTLSPLEFPNVEQINPAVTTFDLVAHRVSIENHFRLQQGKRWVFDEGQIKWSRTCPGRTQ